jgi:hypothetical protein
MNRILWLIILLVFLFAEIQAQQTNLVSLRGRHQIDFQQDTSIEVWTIVALEVPLLVYSNSGQLLAFICKGDTLKINGNSYNDNGKTKFEKILIMPGTEKSGIWELRTKNKFPQGGVPAEIIPIEKEIDFRGSVILIILSILTIVALTRLFNNFSYSFITQPFISIGKISILEQFSTGFFPLIFLFLFLGLSFLIGLLIDLGIYGEYSFGLSLGGYFFYTISTKVSFLIYAICFVLIKFILYNFLGYLARSEELAQLLFSANLIISSILLLIATVLISLTGFENLLFTYPQIVPVIFFIFAAFFGIGMVLTHLNMGVKVPVSVRFFGIVAMEILPTIFIGKIIVTG